MQCNSFHKLFVIFGANHDYESTLLLLMLEVQRVVCVNTAGWEVSSIEELCMCTVCSEDSYCTLHRGVLPFVCL